VIALRPSALGGVQLNVTDVAADVATTLVGRSGAVGNGTVEVVIAVDSGVVITGVDGMSGTSLPLKTCIGSDAGAFGLLTPGSAKLVGGVGAGTVGVVVARLGWLGVSASIAGTGEFFSESSCGHSSRQKTTPEE
jgi:hypothetical protein